jgi:hypothetical protein
MRPRIYGGAARMPGGSLRAGSKRPKKGLHLGSVSAGSYFATVKNPAIIDL